MPTLDGIRVLDHGHVRVGALLEVMLTDLSAEVTKVEPRRRR